MGQSLLAVNLLLSLVVFVDNDDFALLLGSCCLCCFVLTTSFASAVSFRCVQFEINFGWTLPTICRYSAHSTAGSFWWVKLFFCRWPIQENVTNVDRSNIWTEMWLLWHSGYFRDQWTIVLIQSSFFKIEHVLNATNCWKDKSKVKEAGDVTIKLKHLTSSYH